MSALAEFFLAVVSALIELTVMLAQLAAKPIRFALSRNYRDQVRSYWRGNPVRQAAELIGGTTVIVLFTAAIVWWSSAFIRSRQEPSPESRKTMQRIAEFERRVAEQIEARKKTKDDERR